VHQGLPIWSVLPGLRPYQALKAAGGALVVLGFVTFSVNMLATVIVRRPALQPTRAERAEQADTGLPAVPAPAAGR